MPFVPTPFVRYFNPILTATLLGQLITFQNGEGFTVDFQVTRTLTPEPDHCSLRVAGLDPDLALVMSKVFAARNSLSPPGLSTVTVQAGYDAFAQGLFIGDLRTFSSGERDGPDIWTIANADDGGDAIADKPIRPAVSTALQTASQLIAAACGIMGLIPGPSVAVVLNTVDPGVAGPFTAVMAGKCRDLLDHVCRRLSCRWWVRDGQLHLGFRGLVDPSAPAVVITDEILTAPPTEHGSGLVSLSCFMDPRIMPGGQVSYLGTSFRCENVVHSGVTRSADPWISRVTGRAL